MSYRNSEGTRRNQWGSKVIGGREVDGEKKVGTEKKHRDKWGGTTEEGRKGGEGRDAEGKRKTRPPGPSRRLGKGMANGIPGSTKGSCVGRRISRGHDENGEPIGEDAYLPPVLANPGVLVGEERSLADLFCVAPTLEDLFCEVLIYGYVTRTGPREILRGLRLAIEQAAILEWSIGIQMALSSAHLLRQNLFGERLFHFVTDWLRAVRDRFSASQFTDEVLQSALLHRVSEEARSGSSVSGRREMACQEDHRQDGVLDVPIDGRPRGASSRRQPKEQRHGKSAGAVSDVPQHSAQSADSEHAEVFRMWAESSEELQGVWDALRCSLPSLQEVWIAIEKENAARQLGMGDDGIGNIVKGIKVGGGLMGHQLAHENEAPFPQKLAEWFIRSFCPPGGLVLDCFSGSGTTVAAALKLGRRGIGSDLRLSQCQLGAKRCKDVQPELFPG